MRETQLLTTGAFAKKAGVTLRTLHYYDRLGLLSPKQRTESGHRMYSPDDMVRLQQVLTLKFIGLPLKEIRWIMTSPTYDLKRALQAQRQIVAQRARQMRTITRAIDEALKTVSDQALNLDRFASVIKAVQMEDNTEWTKQYYTQEQLDELASREWTPEMQEQATAEWTAIYAEAKRLSAANADPAGPEAQALAARMRHMIDQFTAGDPGIEASLNQMYANRENMPAQYQMGDEESNAYLGKVMAAFRG